MPEPAIEPAVIRPSPFGPILLGEIDIAGAVGNELRVTAGAGVEESDGAAAVGGDGGVAGRRERIELQVSPPELFVIIAWSAEARISSRTGMPKGDQAIVVVDDGRRSRGAMIEETQSDRLCTERAAKTAVDDRGVAGRTMIEENRRTAERGW